MFKRILLTAVLGAGLVFSVANTAQADHKNDRDRGRRDNWGVMLPGSYGYGNYYGAGSGNYPFMHYRGWDKSPDLYWYPEGYGSGAPYLQGGYYGAPVLTDVFGDDYYFAYGTRCNGYRDGYYFGSDGAPISYYGRPFQRRNADCESFHRRNGYWYGANQCSRFEVEKGYSED